MRPLPSRTRQREARGESVTVSRSVVFAVQNGNGKCPVIIGSGAVRAPVALGRTVTAVWSGLLLDVAFPGTGWWPLAPPALALFLLAVEGRGVRTGALLGFCFGLAFFVPLLIGDPHRRPSVAGARHPGSGLLAAFGGLAALGLRAPGGPVVRELIVAALWVGQEALRSRTPFGGFPWGRLAFSPSDAPALGLAAVGGAPLVSFSVALSGTLLAQAVIAVLRRRASVAPPSLDFNAERRAVLDNQAEASRDLAAEVSVGQRPAPDLVLWPENASDVDPLRNPDSAAVISGAVKDVGVHLLVGPSCRSHRAS